MKKKFNHADLRHLNIYSAQSNIKKIEWTQENRLSKDYLEAFKKFRLQINDVFDKQRENMALWKGKSAITEMNKISFKELINQANIKLNKTQGDDKRYEIAAKLIQDVSAFTRVDNLTTVMFHETVIVGLDILQSIYQYLRDFRHVVEILNPGNIVRDIINTVTKDPTHQFDKMTNYPYIGQSFRIINYALGSTKINNAINKAGLLEALDKNKYSLDSNDVQKFKNLIELIVDHYYDYPLSYKAFIETIILHANDLQGLVEIKFSDYKMYIDHNNLIETIKTLFNQTKINYQKFRSLLRDDQREYLEDVTKPGSIYFGRKFNGRYYLWQ